MLLSVLQLNINADNYWSRLIPFLTSHNFDIINLQEICGKDSYCANIHCVRDCYEELKNKLGDKYKSELAIANRFASSPTSYMANGIFYRNSFEFLEKNIVTLFERTTPFPEDSNQYEEIGRNFMHLKLKIADKIISIINTHLAWASTTKEELHQTKQGEILFEYIKKLDVPFILTGDFNLDPQQPLIQKINSLARNLISENSIPTTLNERTHRARVLFPPGAAVDYIFVSKDIRVNKFEVLDKEDFSDHYALITEIEI